MSETPTIRPPAPPIDEPRITREEWRRIHAAGKVLLHELLLDVRDTLNDGQITPADLLLLVDDLDEAKALVREFRRAMRRAR